MVSIKRHTNLIQTYFYWNAWNTDESFDLNNLSDGQKKKLEKIEVVEVLFEAEAKEEDLFLPYESFLNDYFIKSDIPSYLFVCEFSQKQKSKLRSYKGFIKKELATSSDFCLETEVDLFGDYSMFGALIELNKATNNLTSKFFLSNTNSFIINFGETIKNHEPFIKNIINDYVVSDSTSAHIDYAKLILDFCHDKNVIYRTGGDGGSSEISFQAFSGPETKDLVLLQAEMVV